MSKDLLTHKGFNGSMDPSIEDECLHGRILFIDDLITYEGDSVSEIKAAFVEAVDRYLAYCESTGKPANKPYSGSFNVRTGPELHREAVVAAAKAHTSLNDFVCQAIRTYVDLPNGRVEHLHTHKVTVTVQGEGELQSQWLSSGGETANWRERNVRKHTH
jgi:predicted HicB family RNase H-like nuclease